jgi:hypothetical protein
MQAPGDSVQREHYDALLAEKQELQQRLWTVLEERRDGAMVPRELFDSMQQEKRQLQEKMMLMLDELLRLRQQPAQDGTQPREEDRSNVRPFRGTRKGDS